MKHRRIISIILTLAVTLSICITNIIFDNTLKVYAVNGTPEVEDINWSGDCYTEHTPTFDLGEKLPEDVIIVGITVNLSNILSGCTPTYTANSASVNLTTKVFDEPVSETITIIVKTSNYGDIPVNINVNLTGKYIVNIDALPVNDIYDGNSHNGYSTITGTLNNGNSYEGTYTYTYTKADGTLLEGAPKELGSYKVMIAVPEDNDEYTGSITLNFEIIEKAEASYQLSENGEWVNGSFTGALANVYEGGTVKLLDDISLNETVKIAKDVTIISNDTNAPKMITTSTDRHGYLLRIAADVKMEDIIVDGGSASNITASRALIAVGDGTNSGKLSLGTGAIIRNNNNITDRGAGGGICVIFGDLSIDGGKITNNQAYNGGGIAVMNKVNTVTLTKGEISYNSANANSGGKGGAIYLSDGTVVMEGGEIKNNSAKYGGGIYVNVTRLLELSGGKIIENSATKWGAGLLVAPSANVVLSGKIMISDNENVSSEPGDNLYVDGYEYNGIHMPTITLEGFDESADVEIYSWLKSKENEDLLFALPKEGYSITVTDLKQLSYEDENYMLTKNADGNLVLTEKVEYTITFDSNDGSTVESQTVQKDLTVDKPADPTKEGYIFDGWYSDESLETVYDFNTLVTKEMTLYAKWLTVIDSIKVNMTEPTIGATPKDTVTVEGNILEVVRIVWNDESGNAVTKFEDGHEYTAIVSLKYNEETHSISEQLKDNLYLNGTKFDFNEEAGRYYTVKDDGTVELKYTFDLLKGIQYPTNIFIKDDIEVEAEHVHDEEDIHAEVIKTDSEVKEIVGRKNAVATVELEETDHKVQVTVELGKNHAEEIIYVVKVNEETGELEMMSAGKTDKKGLLVFTTEPSETLTLTTALPEDFCSQGEVKEGIKYHVTDEGELYKGWLKHDSHWHFFDYKTGVMKKNGWLPEMKDWYFFKEGIMVESEWIAKDNTGSVWYYVDADGRFVRNTWIDGYYIDANGEWRA